MYIIEKPLRGKIRRETIAAFELSSTDGIIFDESRGDPNFVANLKANGVKAFDQKTKKFRYILPSEGQAFVDACLEEFCSAPLVCNDEEELDKVRRRYPSPATPRTSDPPPISVAS
jgi:hypothetical protein